MPLSKEDYNLYDEFIQKFSTEKLSSLSLDNYSNFNNDSFCYWIENKLNNWGDIHGATSYKFGIYRWKDDPRNKKAQGADSDDKYAWLTKYGKTADEAYNNILKMIIQIANYSKEGKIEEIDKIDISEMFKWKIAFLYSDKKLINWFSKDILIKFVNYLGGDVNNQTPTSDLQKFLLKQKGEKSLEEFNEELTTINRKYLGKTKKKFWIVKVTDEDYWDKTIKNNVWYSQQRYGFQTTSAVTNFLNQIKNVKENDIFLLAYGNIIFAYGIVQKYSFATNQITSIKKITSEKSYKYKTGLVCFSDSEVFYENLENGEEDWGQRINVKKWLAYNPQSEITTEGVANEIKSGNSQMSIYEVSEEYGEIKMRELKENQTVTEKFAQMLKATKNLILHGAPGTGKTYLAIEIAKAMGCSKDEYKLVQFHPSYDYTDFVEGLRPAKGENGKADGFELKDGEFKKFCKKAIGTYSEPVDNFNECFQKIAEKLDNENTIEIPLISGKGNFYIAINSNGDGFVTMIKDEESGEFKKDKTRFLNYDQCYNVYRGLPGTPKGGFDNYRKAIIDYMKKKLGLYDYKTGTIDAPDKDKKFVFIIDEINRGELSKIFGELFFAIDPGYRGEKEKIETQYQNLVKEDDVFAKGFYVPDNVYIIGTMNDIDRSVESMDFAMRRRFTFKEITAEESMKMLDIPETWKGLTNIPIDDIKNHMKKLNDKIIDNEIDLSEDYKIGAAYFIKYGMYVGQSNPFDCLWEYHLEPLLREYLRGQDNIDEKLEKLKEAYNS